MSSRGKTLEPRFLAHVNGAISVRDGIITCGPCVEQCITGEGHAHIHKYPPKSSTTSTAMTTKQGEALITTHTAGE